MGPCILFHFYRKKIKIKIPKWNPPIIIYNTLLLLPGKGHAMLCRNTRRNLVHFNRGHLHSCTQKMHKQINLLAPGRYPWCTHGGCPPVANQIDLFMHFLGASHDGLVKRPVEMDKISSSERRSYTLQKEKGPDMWILPSLAYLPPTLELLDYSCVLQVQNNKTLNNITCKENLNLDIQAHSSSGTQCLNIQALRFLGAWNLSLFSMQSQIPRTQSLPNCDA